MMLNDLGDRMVWGWKLKHFAGACAWRLKQLAGLFALVSMVAFSVVLWVLIISFSCDVGNWLRRW